jgi:hypothetical protein
MLVGQEEGSLAYVRNTGTVTNPAWELIASQYPGIDIGIRAVPAAADINGDSLLDLILGDGDGGINVYQYEGPGTASPTNTFSREEWVQVAGTIRLYGHNIDTGTDLNTLNVEGWVGLLMLYDEEGRPIPATNHHGSMRLTPTGFPILHGEKAHIWPGTQVAMTDWQYIGGNAVEGSLNFAIQLPHDLPLGTYRPFISLNFSGVPTSSMWPATAVSTENFWYQEAPLPPIVVAEATTSKGPQAAGSSTRLNWQLLMNDPINGLRGTGAREDGNNYQAASFVVHQGAPYVVPAVEPQTNTPIKYRLEPFLPMISYSDRTMSNRPLIPFSLPGGQLCVTVEEPDGHIRDLGCEMFKQSAQQTPSSLGGYFLNSGSIQIDDIYSLAVASDRFETTFNQDGHHTITMTGTLEDIWGNSYEGGGTYDVWVAQPLDTEFGTLPGTPFAVGDAFNPTLSFQPQVAASVNLTVTHYPQSDAGQAVVHTLSGEANEYGYFSGDGTPIMFTEPGEYRAEISASYRDPETGDLFMTTANWGGIVMTPPAQAELIAHGRRGLDNLEYIPNQWFVTCSLNPPPPQGTVPHILNPYFNGDIIWSKFEEEDVCDGFAIRMAASVQDTVGTIEAAIENRFQRTYYGLQTPGDFNERVLFDELPLFSSTQSGRAIQLFPQEVDQIAYAYLSAQRPGVRVRETVAEDGHSSGYWRLDSIYDHQLGVGVQGDLPHDFKFQYIGVVYRDLATGHNEYVGQGTGWIHLPDDDPTGSRVMPPFSGPGNGGWPTTGGPLMTLKDEDIHMFILPTGVRPGVVLEVGDTFHFAGHIMPTLDSKVHVTVVAPGGSQYTVSGQANRVGYFYNPVADFIVDEPGLWTVDVQVWHDGQIGSGDQVNCNPADPFNPTLPCPSGNVLGSDNGRFHFYVVPGNAPRLDITTPLNGYLYYRDVVDPIAVSGSIPEGLSNVSVEYTIRMPGFILEEGQAIINGNSFNFEFNPASLNEDFSNLDLISRVDWPGLADTFSISILLRGQRGGDMEYHSNVITIQGKQVIVGENLHSGTARAYLPMVLSLESN